MKVKTDMKKLLLVVALVAGVLVVKAQDTKDQDVSSTKNSKTDNSNSSTREDENSRSNEDADDSQGREQDNANVPAKAKETLKSKYPEATNVEWGKDGQNHE